MLLQNCSTPLRQVGLPFETHVPLAARSRAAQPCLADKMIIDLYTMAREAAEMNLGVLQIVQPQLAIARQPKLIP